MADVESLDKEGGEMGQWLRRALNGIVDELAARARRYEEGELKVR